MMMMIVGDEMSLWLQMDGWKDWLIDDGK
jgi:hypothetical protein